jgi:hypothetical protein
MDDPYVFVFTDTDDMRNALSKAIEELCKLSGVSMTTDDTDKEWIFLDEKHHVLARIQVDTDQRCLILGDVTPRRAEDVKYLFALAAEQYGGLEACEMQEKPIQITSTLSIHLIAESDAPDVLVVAFDGTPPNDAFREHVTNIIQAALQKEHINTDYDWEDHTIVITKTDTFGQESCDNKIMSKIAEHAINENILDLQWRLMGPRENTEPHKTRKYGLKPPAESKSDGVLAVSAKELLPAVLRTLQKSVYQKVISKDDVTAYSQKVATVIAKNMSGRAVVTKNKLAETARECFQDKMSNDRIWEFLIDDMAQCLHDTYKQAAAQKSLASGGPL